MPVIGLEAQYGHIDVVECLDRVEVAYMMGIPSRDRPSRTGFIRDVEVSPVSYVTVWGIRFA